MKIPEILYTFAKIFKESGFQCMLVGGAMRDLYMSRDVNDFDFATDALPEDVRKIFRRVIPTGIKHGTVTVLFKGHSFEVTTFRIDGEYTDKRHPDSIRFSSTIDSDLERRDFTINAIAYDLNNRKIIDPHAGIKDIGRKIIRAIGDPDKRFGEDCLRTLRACRFAAQLEFTIEPGTFAGLIKAAPGILAISWERIRDEVIKTIQAEHAVSGFEMMRLSGLLKLILPELSECIGVNQEGFHSFDVYYHSIYSMEAVPRNDLKLRLAALFHDIGKPRAMSTEKGETHFFGHEKQSSEMVEALLTRLKFPNTLIKDVCHLIYCHMFNYSPDWTDSAVRRLAAKVGLKNMDDLIALRKADHYGMRRKAVLSPDMDNMRLRITEIEQMSHALSVRDLKVNGTDLIRDLGLSPGPKIGIILDTLLDAVMEDPLMNDREKLMNLARLFDTKYLEGDK